MIKRAKTLTEYFEPLTQSEKKRFPKNIIIQTDERFEDPLTRRPTNWWGTAKRDVTHPTATVVYNICYNLLENVHALPCIESHWRVDRDNNTTPASH